MKIGTAPRTFQELIFGLQRYWSDQGCVILQPYDMEVGAVPIFMRKSVCKLGTKRAASIAGGPFYSSCRSSYTRLIRPPSQT